MARLAKLFQDAKSVVFAEQSALTMKDMDTLRAKARKEGVKVLVTKKTLTTLAAIQASLKDVDVRTLPKSIMTVVGLQDEIAPARLVAELAKKHDTVRIVGGVFEGAFTSQERMVALSKLPSKQELLGQLVGTLAAPMTGFARVLSGNLSGLVTVLKRIQEQKA